MNKKKLTNILLLGAGACAILSCSGSNDSKDIDSLNDFIEVASASSLKISSVNVLSNKQKGAETSTSGASLKLSAYSGNNCIAAGKATYEGKETTLSHIVYTLDNGEGQSQEFYINTSTKKGVVYDGAGSHSWYVAMVKELIGKEYENIRAIYDEMKGYIGKPASEIGYSSYTLRRSIATNVAGYVFHGFKKEGNSEIETYRYITMDKFDEDWVFSSYSERIATTTFDEKGYSSTLYDVSEATFAIVYEYSDLIVNLTDYSISGETTTGEELEVTSTGVLSPK